MTVINAAPTKSFFISTLVKDVQLMDAILDLIDNSIDSYIEHDLTEYKKISIIFNKDSFIIEDTCGGIPKEAIYNKVFRFGMPSQKGKKTIGAFGIGMKRSIFKMGRNILIESDDGESFFSVKIGADWIDNDNLWDLNLEKEESSKGKPFTKLTVTDLFPNISEEFQNNYFANDLRKRIKDAYSKFIEEKVSILVNDVTIEPYEFNFLNDVSKKFVPLYKKMPMEDVTVEIYAGYTAPPSKKDDDAVFGWNIFCNDRLIIRNDTSTKTGWGVAGTKKYHYPEDNRFLGLIFFSSDNPLSLPWNTTKEDVQADSKIYRQTLVEMREITNKFVNVIRVAGRTNYPGTEETIGNSIFKDVTYQPKKYIITESIGILPDIKGDFGNEMLIDIPAITSIQYSKKWDVVKKVKNKLDKPYMSNKEVGEATFDYFVKLEGINDV